MPRIWQVYTDGSGKGEAVMKAATESVSTHLATRRGWGYDPWHPPCSVYVTDILFCTVYVQRSGSWHFSGQR